MGALKKAVLGLMALTLLSSCSNSSNNKRLFRRIKLTTEVFCNSPIRQSQYYFGRVKYGLSTKAFKIKKKYFPWQIDPRMTDLPPDEINLKYIREDQYHAFHASVEGLEKVASALNSYKKETGKYPARIEQLQEKYPNLDIIDHCDDFDKDSQKMPYHYFSDTQEFMMYSGGWLLGHMRDENGTFTRKMKIEGYIQNGKKIKQKETFEMDAIRYSSGEGLKYLRNAKSFLIKDEKKLIASIISDSVKEKAAITKARLNNLVRDIEEYKERYGGYPQDIKRIGEFLKKELYPTVANIQDRLMDKLTEPEFGSVHSREIKQEYPILEREFNYISDKKDYIIYSVGQNIRDDNGSIEERVFEYEGKTYQYTKDIVQYSSQEGYNRLRKINSKN